MSALSQGGSLFALVFILITFHYGWLTFRPAFVVLGVVALLGGIAVFGFPHLHDGEERAQATKALAANQGLYNGFLAAGLGWGLSLGLDGHAIRVFFLGCVIIAGVFGAATVGRKILYVQALPAAVALALTCLSA